MLLALFAVVLVLTVAAVITLRVAFSGSALAARVCARINADMRGKVAIGSIDWPLSRAPAIVRGGWVPVVLRDVEVRDADGIVVLRAPRIRAEVDAHAVLFGHHDVVARRVVMEGGEIVLREIAEARPQFDGDTIVSLVAAFESRAAPQPGTRAPAGARLELRDAEVRGATVVVEALPIDAAATRHELHVRVADVSGRGALAYDARVSPARLTFAATPRSGAGEVVARGRRIALASVDVHELAQADTTIAFGADITLAGGEHVRVDGTLRDYWPTGHFAADSRLTVTVTGLQHSLGLDPPLAIDVPPLVLLHDLHTGDGALAELTARGAGGSVRVAARWGGGADGEAPTWLTGTVAIADPLELAPWLPPAHRREFGDTLRGNVAIRVDAAGDGRLHVHSPDLRLERLRVDAGELVVDDARHLRILGLHLALPRLEGTYDCTVDPTPPVAARCDGKFSGDTRALARLRELNTW